MSDELRAAFARLYNADRLPQFDDFLALGKELANAGLSEFIYKAIDNSSIAAGALRGLLFAATRRFDSRLSPEDHARLNDLDHLLKALDGIEKRHGWPEIKGELVKFCKRVSQELEDRTPPKEIDPDRDQCEPERRTLGWLITTLTTYEDLRRRSAADTNAALFNSAESRSRIQDYNERLALDAAIANAPGIERIRLLCDELDNSDGLTAGNVRKLRVKVCRRRPCDIPTANALTLDEAADVIEATSKQVEQGDNNRDETAIRLWERNPVEVFERLRDRVCETVQRAVALHHRAANTQPDTPLATIAQADGDALYDAHCEAQALWYATPVRRYLERAEGPVFLDNLDERAKARVSGSCYHDLMMGLGAFTIQGIRGGGTANGFRAALRLRTAAGDDVSQRLLSMMSHVRCECRQGIARWQDETRLGQGSMERMSHREGTPTARLRQFVELGEQVAELALRSRDRRSPSDDEREQERQAVLSLSKQLDTLSPLLVAMTSYQDGLLIEAYGSASSALARGHWSQRLAGSYSSADMPEYVGWQQARQGIRRLLAQGEGAGNGEQQWLTVKQAATISACDPGVISRAVDAGQLKSNGKKRKERRIDAADLSRWQLKRAERDSAVESEASIERKLQRARGELRNYGV
jgi:hypothetical protein